MFGYGNRRKMTLRERWNDVRATCIRVTLRWWKVCLAVAAIGALTFFGSSVYRTLKYSSHFRLARISVSGNRVLPSTEIAAICGLREGRTNVLFSSADDIRETCTADPRIRHAVVRLVPPDAAEVIVEEQSTALYAATDSGLWSVNDYGEAWGPADPADLHDLPLLLSTAMIAAVGEGEGDGGVDEDDSEAVLREAMSLARTVGMRGSPWSDQSLLLAFDPDLGFSVTSAGRGLRAHFGRAPFVRKLERLVEALDIAARDALVVEEAYLDNESKPNEVTFRLALSGTLACVDDVLGRGGADAVRAKDIRPNGL